MIILRFFERLGDLFLYYVNHAGRMVIFLFLSLSIYSNRLTINFRTLPSRFIS